MNPTHPVRPSPPRRGGVVRETHPWIELHAREGSEPPRWCDPAAWTVGFLATNAVFLRYGYSSTTDMLAILLQAAALHAVMASDGKLAPLSAGIWSALATLTRYNSVFLVPAAIACYAGLAPAPAMSRRRAIAFYLGAFALVSAPWVLYSLASGHVPGASLFTRFSTFYMIPDA